MPTTRLTTSGYGGRPYNLALFQGREEVEVIAVDQVTGGYENHPFLRQPKKEKKRQAVEVVSPVIEVKVDKRRKPKVEKQEQATERLNLTETYKQEFTDAYFQESITEHLKGEARDEAERELKRKRRNRAVALLLLH